MSDYAEVSKVLSYNILMDYFMNIRNKLVVAKRSDIEKYLIR